MRSFVRNWLGFIEVYSVSEISVNSCKFDSCQMHRIKCLFGTNMQQTTELSYPKLSRWFCNFGHRYRNYVVFIAQIDVKKLWLTIRYWIKRYSRCNTASNAGSRCCRNLFAVIHAKFGSPVDPQREVLFCSVKQLFSQTYKCCLFMQYSASRIQIRVLKGTC